MDLKFKDGKFKILQISDAQDMNFVRKTMLYMLNKACDKVNPDYIVFTGDNILGNHLKDYRWGLTAFLSYALKSLKTSDDLKSYVKSLKAFTDLDCGRDMPKEKEFKNLKKALSYILDIPEKRNIPFSAIFGNHDDMNSFTKDEQADIFRSSPLNIGLENKGDLSGTYGVPIYSEDGKKIVFYFYMIDSARCDKSNDECYLEVTEKTVEWFKNESEKLKKQNGGEPYPSIVFIHVPLKETLNLITECPESESSISFNGKYYKLKDNVTGVLGEMINPVTSENGFFNAIKSDGGVLAVASGHDHRNCFIGEYEGVKFIATPCASFRCYANEKRGVRVFELSENAPKDFKTYNLSYWDLCGKNIISVLRWFFDADEAESAKNKVLALAFALSVVSVPILIKKLKRLK